jgi:pimeloyl-ACP methyl ester carboxylesterase
VYEDPAWTPPIGEREQRAAEFRAHADWTLDDIRAAYPRWDSGAHEAKLAAVKRWDPATTEFIVTDFDVFDPAPPTVPALLMLADPSTLVAPDRAAELEKMGFEVRVVPGAGHVIHNDDFAGFRTALDGWL